MSLTEQQQTKLDKIQLDASWKHGLSDFLLSTKMDALKQFLVTEIKANKVIYPPNALIFNAFNTTPLANVKVVILGQDPYHGPNQAHGLSFSVQKGLALPPSLRNIFHELNKDLGIDIPKHGDLTRWAQQGVLLLNSVLTVEAGQPTSHQKQGFNSGFKIVRLNSEKIINSSPLSFVHLFKRIDLPQFIHIGKMLQIGLSLLL